MKKLAIILGLLAFGVGCQSENNLGNTGPIFDGSAPPTPETPTQEDRVVQVQVPKVDILFIVDNSCSMIEEQTALANNFPIFMNYFLGSGLDYHIGVVSTDTDNQNLAGTLRTAGGVNYIQEGTANPTNVFQQMVSMGTSGSATEQGREAAYGAVELRGGPGGANEGFTREEAALHLIFITDEDDYSGANIISKAEFIEWMKTKKWSADMVTAHSIVGSSFSCGEERSSDYIEYAQATGGVLFEICQPDWAPMLNELGLQASGLKREYFLSEIPVPDTIEVKVVSDGVTNADFQVGEGLDVEYIQSRNSIVFNEFVPDPFAEVMVKYQVLAALEDGESVEEDVNE